MTTTKDQLQAQVDQLKANHAKDIKKLEEQIAALDKPAGRWKPQHGSEYYTIPSNGVVEKSKWLNDATDVQRFSLGLVHKTREKAEVDLKKRKLQVQLEDLAAASWEGASPDWGNVLTLKHFIYFTHDTNRFTVDFNTVHNSNHAYFKTKESAQAAIETMGKENLKLLFGIE